MYRFITVFSALILIACGGGGSAGGNSGDAGTVPPAPPPSVSTNPAVATLKGGLIVNGTGNSGYREQWSSFNVDRKTVRVSWSGDSIETVNVELKEGLPYPHWLDEIDFVTGESGGELKIVADGRVPLLSTGKYDTTLTVSGLDQSGAAVASQDLPVSFAVYENWNVRNTRQTFEFIEGQLEVPDNKVIFSGDDVSWTVSGNSSLVFDKTEGTTPDVLKIGIDPSKYSEGFHVETAQVEDENGRSLTITMDILVRANDLNLSRRTALFTATPSYRKTSQTISITQDNGSDIEWAATSNAAWVNISGQGTNAMTLSVDPSGLPLDQLSMSSVDITAAANGSPIKSTVVVGLWNSLDDATSNIVIESNLLPSLATDPIRPFVYVINQTDVFAFNAYTGERVHQILGLGNELTDILVDQTGSKLFVYDNFSDTLNILNLESFEVVETPSLLSRPMAFGHIDGGNYIFSERRNVLNLDTGGLFTISFGGGSPDDDSVDVSYDGHTSCTLTRDRSPYQLNCYSLGKTPEGELIMTEPRTLSGLGGSFGNEIALSDDGNTAYVASSGYQTYDTMTFAREALRIGNYVIRVGSVEVAEDGNVYLSTEDGAPFGRGFLFDNNGRNYLGAFDFPSRLQRATMHIVPDGRRVAAISVSGDLMIVDRP